MKKKRLLIVLCAAVLVFSGGIYFYFFSKPNEFLSDDVVLETINSYFPNAEIQETIIIEDTHVYVPFLTNDRPGSSYWIWKNRNWELGAIDVMQTPRIWKINPKDPTTFVVVWNIESGDEVDEFAVYLTNQRSYNVIYNVHRYTPKVQFETRVPLNGADQTYGMFTLPDEWIVFLENYLEVEGENQSDSIFFDNFHHHSNVQFGWIPYDKSGNVHFPSSENGRTGHGFGNIHLDFLMSISEYEIE
ncbi:hypothetical protein ACERII_00335 [Evansella sp. AB-rgal1]|uniref:hypothetical protein n=1 Tax=Evansella sp. AB-rgal1 TaxID=3242696 RepID=UPI00359E3567